MIPTMLRPPLQCRINSKRQHEYSDGQLVLPSHILEWKGEIIRRYDAEKNDQWKLYLSSTGQGLWVELSHIEVIGRTPGKHTVKEAITDIVKKIKEL